jgi:acetolactate synthase-1/2/3 large subunit
MGIPLITSMNGRGIVPEDHPMSLGSLGNTPEVRELFPTLDLLIVGASKLRAHETADLSLPLPERRVQIDVDPAAEGRTYTSDFFLCADVGLALDALADRLEGRLDIDRKLADDVAKAKHQATESLREFLGEYSCFPGDLREAMPRDALWVRDITLNNMTWGHRIFPVYGPRDSIYPVGAAIGPGMQLGIGAALAADGRKVVAMCGDGGFQLDLVEVWTAAQEKADVVFLVMNDNAYGVIGHIQDTMYEGRRFYDKLQVPELEKIAELTGMPYVRVEKAQDMGPAVAEMLKVGGPSLVEVDMNAIGEFPRYFKPPPYVEKENEEAAD